MKFIGFLTIFFVLLYSAIVVHYFKFDHSYKKQSLANLAQKVKDTRLSTSFISSEYKGFVYVE